MHGKMLMFIVLLPISGLGEKNVWLKCGSLKNIVLVADEGIGRMRATNWE